tara:strand:- start:160 stop:303 length:144 start_codon:yes stop_codon:yes gene_type:complete
MFNGKIVRLSHTITKETTSCGKRYNVVINSNFSFSNESPVTIFAEIN